MLADLRCQTTQAASADSLAMREGNFTTKQNGLVAANAEHYYRAMLQGGAASSNVRDRHMLETLHRLLRPARPTSQAITWEHTTRIGTAPACHPGRQVLSPTHTPGQIKPQIQTDLTDETDTPASLADYAACITELLASDTGCPCY